MYTKQNLIEEYHRETGHNAYHQKIMTIEYTEWLEEKLVIIIRSKNEK